MPSSVETRRPAFTLDELRQEDGRVVVRGTWSGVRGMRFVRPTLTAGGRRALATLEHKPWAPDGEGPWVAAFPWDGDEIDPATASIDVAPSVTVRLDGGTAAQAPPAPDPIAVERVRFERRETEVEYLRSTLRRAESDRDRALAQREEAVRDREAAVRTRARMEAQREEAVAALRDAQRARDAAEEGRAEARRQRDEVVVAYRALEARLRAAEAAAVAAPEPEPERERDRDPEHVPAPVARGDDAPLGVKTVPAVGPELADLVAARPQHPLTQLDLYAFRFFGVVAAICFILLLVSLVAAFV